MAARFWSKAWAERLARCGPQVHAAAMIRRVFAAIAALSFTFPVIAQAEPSEADYRRHVETLASENFQGRRPGTIGAAVAAHYITSQFAEAGLRPGWHGSFYQSVELVERTPLQARMRWSGGRGSGGWNPDSLLLIGDAEMTRLDDQRLVYAGYGLDPDYSASRELIDGAVVLIRAGAPDDADDPPRTSRRIAALADAGAAAVLVLAEDDEEWSVFEDYMARGRTDLAGADRAQIEGYVAPLAGRALLRQAGFSNRSVPQSPVALDMVINLEVTTAIRSIDGYNVVGRLPGTGDQGEAVAFLAHYDHFGVCAPGEADEICNGAVDNASGTAALIEVAHALADGARPIRDIYFVATTAEEMGLLGAEAWAENPSIPLDKIVAALNLDTIAIGPRGAPVGIVGRGMTPLDPIVDQVTRELGREVYASEEPNAFVERQDGWTLFQRGVPAIMAGGSFTDFERLSAFLQGPYHGPDDNFDASIELGGAWEDVLLHIALARAFADPGRYTPLPR